MKSKLKELKNIVAENCVTIILNTNRTSPDNKKDPIALKNLVKEAESRLLATENKRNVQKIIQNLYELESKIDHNYNLDSLILFVNEDIAEYVRLPIPVQDRVVIDHTFATRDLVRALHLETHYYVLVLDHHKARLIEALNDKVIHEVSNPFPVESKHSYSTYKAEYSGASKHTNIIAEFFNHVDKELNKVRKDNPLPVLICTESSNYHEYLKIADQKQSIFDFHLNKNRMDEKAHAIVAEAWKMVQEYKVKKNNARKDELLQAVSQNKFLSDTNEIWQAIKQGRVQTLFIEEDLFQPAVLENDQIVYVSEDMRNRKDVIDDIYDELIEANMAYGGDIVFLPKGELSQFNGFGAITRY